MNTLPDEILINIFFFLDIKSSYYFSSAAKRYYNIFNDHNFQRSLLVQIYPWIRRENIPNSSGVVSEVPFNLKSYVHEIDELCKTVRGCISPDVPCIDNKVVDQWYTIYQYEEHDWFMKNERPYKIKYETNVYPKFSVRLLMFMVRNSKPELFELRLDFNGINEWSLCYESPIQDLYNLDDINRFLQDNNYRKFNRDYKLTHDISKKAEHIGLMVPYD